jgi:nucleoside phosphorylase
MATNDARSLDAQGVTADGREEALARFIIDFDPRDPRSYHFSTAPYADQAIDVANAVQADPIPWPAEYVPTPTSSKARKSTDPLPEADVLVVTYTVAEGYALADVLTPSLETADWTPYRNGWQELKTEVKHGAPSLERDQAGLWATTTIGTKKVVVMKSDLHPSTDGAKLPLRTLWKQIISQARPKLIISTGTAGGIGAETLLGDVVVTQQVRWDCSKTFANAPFAHAEYTSTGVLETQRFSEARSKLIPVNATHLPAAKRTPAIVLDTSGKPNTTITTDFFAFDDAKNSYGLRTYEPDARAVEMDDAAMALACADLKEPPTWVSVRNASDPQMNAATLAEEKQQAAVIYEQYGYWTSIGSAITCWALIASLPD